MGLWGWATMMGYIQGCGAPRAVGLWGPKAVGLWGPKAVGLWGPKAVGLWGPKGWLSCGNRCCFQVIHSWSEKLLWR